MYMIFGLTFEFIPLALQTSLQFALGNKAIRHSFCVSGAVPAFQVLISKKGRAKTKKGVPNRSFQSKKGVPRFRFPKKGVPARACQRNYPIRSSALFPGADCNRPFDPVYFLRVGFAHLGFSHPISQKGSKNGLGFLEIRFHSSNLNRLSDVYHWHLS